MRRRTFIAFFGTTAVTGPFAARAQQGAVPVIGYLSGASAAFTGDLAAAFRSGLNETGFVPGSNVKIEFRAAEGQYERLLALAAELVRRRVNVIAAPGSNQALAAKRATATIPIVFYSTADPVAAGLVASLGRPGGNATGVSTLTISLVAKRIELLRDLVPRATRIGILINPNSAIAASQIKEAEQAARASGFSILVLTAGSERDFGAAFAALVAQRAGALVVGTDPILSSGADQLIALAARHSVPAIFQSHEFASAGGLMSYGASRTDALRLVGIYVGRILKGAKPADLPVLQPTKFELVINLKTAKALGLNLAPVLLARADEVIE